jgi:hypothetical protein
MTGPLSSLGISRSSKGRIGRYNISVQCAYIIYIDAFIKGVALLGFNTPPLGALPAGGAGDLFPSIRKDFKEKSSIPQGFPCGCSLAIYAPLFLSYCVHISIIDA